MAQSPVREKHAERASPRSRLEVMHSGGTGAGGDDAELFDFLDEYTRDLERGRVRRLAEYLARYPGHEEAIAREFVRQQGGGEGAAQSAATTTGGSSAAIESGASANASDERRIGPYRLVRELGVGGQGAVWLCEDTRIAREVALKFMPSSIALLSADRRRRMQREAEVVSRLQHPSICPVYEAQIEHDPPYIAMRYVEGETLASAIGRARAGERSGPLPLPPRNGVELRRVLHFVERAARALHAAHEAGVIHRDIKPGNVMVTAEGEPVLLDFGQARDEHAELDQRTLSGEVFGTPMYMSPEQVAGSSSGVDRRTDVWSLGASLFEALTLARPFLGESVPAVLLAIQKEALPPVRRMNAAIEDDAAVVVETALEKDLARRYATALEFAEDLRRVREYEPIRARAAGPLLRLRRWAQRQPALAASIAIVIGSLLTGLVWTLHLLEREQDANRKTSAAQVETLEALDHALARHVAGRSREVLEDDPALALALGVFADEIKPGLYATRAALLPALEACRLARQLDGGVSARLVLDATLARDSQQIFAGLDDCSLQAWNARSGADLFHVLHPDWPLVAVRAHPSGTWLATVGEDGAVRRFDATYGELRDVWPALGERASALELDASGEQLAVLGVGGALALLESTSGAVRWRTRLASREIGRLRFSPDGRWLIAAPSNRGGAPTGSRLFVFDALDGKQLALVEGSRPAPDSDAPPAAGAAALSDFDLSSDSQALVLSDQRGVVRIVALPRGLELEPALEHRAPASAVRFAGDGRSLIVGLDEGERARLVLWDLEARTSRELATQHGARIVSLDVTEDGARFVSTSRDTRIQTWTIAGEPLESFNAWLQPVETRWTPDGERLVTLGAAHYLQVWWGESPPDVYRLAGHGAAVKSVGFSLSGRYALSLGEDGVARLWSTPGPADPRDPRTATSRPVAAMVSGFERDWISARLGTQASGLAPGALLAEFGAPQDPLVIATFSPRGAIVTASASGVLTWRHGHDAPLLSEQIEGRPLSLHFGGPGIDDPRGMAYLRTAVVSSTGRVRVWSSGCMDSGPVDLDDQATCCALGTDPHTALIAVGRRDASVRVYDLDTRSVVAEHSWPSRRNAAPVALVVRPDNRQLVAACSDARVRFFELTGERQPQLDFSAFPLRDVAYNADATRLLATGPNGRAAMRLIDLARQQSDKSVRHEVYHAGNITSGSFDPSGRYVLTTSEDGSALVREAAQGERVVKFESHRAPVLCGAFSPGAGDLRVISGDASGALYVWPVDPAPAARARKPREIREWEHAREERLAAPLPYRKQLERR